MANCRISTRKTRKRSSICKNEEDDCDDNHLAWTKAAASGYSDAKSLGNVLFHLSKNLSAGLATDPGVWKALCISRFGSGFRSIPKAIVKAKGGYAGIYSTLARDASHLVRDPKLKKKEVYAIPKPSIGPSDLSFFIQIKVNDETILSETYSGDDFGAMFGKNFFPSVHVNEEVHWGDEDDSDNNWNGVEGTSHKEYDFDEWRKHHPTKTQYGDVQVELPLHIQLPQGKTVSSEATIYLLCEKGNRCICIHKSNKCCLWYQPRATTFADDSDASSSDDWYLESDQFDIPLVRQWVPGSRKGLYHYDEFEDEDRTLWGEQGRMTFAMGSSTFLDLDEEGSKILTHVAGSAIGGIFAFGIDLTVLGHHEEDGEGVKTYVTDSITHLTLQCSLWEKQAACTSHCLTGDGCTCGNRHRRRAVRTKWRKSGVSLLNILEHTKGLVKLSRDILRRRY